MGAKVIVALLISLCVLNTSGVYAGSRATQAVRFEHADRNDDGKVDRKEIKMENRFEIHQRSKVNTPAEMKYDANSDGALDPVEAREMLKDKQILINTQGQAKVNSALEAKYDTNQDGVIDRDEAVALRADLKD